MKTRTRSAPSSPHRHFAAGSSLVAVACLLLLVAGTADAGVAGGKFKGATPMSESGLLQGRPFADQEMVAGFIVKPHAWRGKKVRGELAARDARGLSVAANRQMSVARAMSGGAHVVKLQQAVPLAEARVIAARLMRDGSVELAEPDRIMYPLSVPQDPGYANQWHYYPPAAKNGPVPANVGGANLPDAWELTKGRSGIKVAVLDTGYRPHEDAPPVLSGYDFISDSTNANDGDGRDADPRDPGDWTAANACNDGEAKSDSSWHGTHVAGTIAASMNNARGGTGIAPDIGVMPIRALGRCGGTTSDIVDAMRWAAKIAVPGVPAHHYTIRVLNMSLGATGSCSQAFQAAVTEVVAKGITIVAATGNDAALSLAQPANCNGVMAVTAHALDGDNADYANIASGVFISAPGGGCGTAARLANTGCVAGSNEAPAIYSNGNAGKTVPGSDAYSLKIGTSMAAPNVAGTIALMLSLDESLGINDIKSHLQRSARPHPDASICLQDAYKDKCGAGLLDAGAALASVQSGITAPAVHASDPQVVASAAAVTLSAGAVAADDTDIVSYQWAASASNPMPVALSGALTSEASFTAPATGSYAFTVTVTDSENRTGSASTTVTVNTAPTLNPIPQQSVVAGAALNFSVSASDVDGNKLIFHALSALPAGASFGADGVFRWPSATPVGKYSLQYYASDDYADSATGTVTIAVTSPPSGGGGGSMSGGALIGLGLLAAVLRLRHRRSAEPSTAILPPES